MDEGLDSESWSALGVHVLGRLRLVAQGQDTVVRDSAEVQVPRPRARYTVQVVAAAHQTMLANLKRRVEEGPLPAAARPRE